MTGFAEKGPIRDRVARVALRAATTHPNQNATHKLWMTYRYGLTCQRAPTQVRLVG